MNLIFLALFVLAVAAVDVLGMVELWRGCSRNWTKP